MEIKTIIIDDEQPARELIKHYLNEFQEITIAGEASNGFEAIKLIKESNPELIFLDVQMPKLTGLEMLELMENHPEIIFSTAYDEFAIKAFEMNAIDYLLKPYSKERFKLAVEKALLKINTGNYNIADYQNIKQSLNTQFSTLNRIAIKDKQQIHVIPVTEINYIEAEGDYVALHTSKGKFLKEKTMKYFEGNLPSLQFIRIHRSYIVNVEEVSKIELYEKETYRVYLKNGIVLKASSAGYKLMKEVIRL